MSVAVVVMAFLALLLRPVPTKDAVYTPGFVAVLMVAWVMWLGAVAAVLWALLRLEGKL